jgi:glycosyltransferase involved in cell wall biosynthesis
MINTSQKSILFLIPSLQQGGLENAVTVIANSFAKKDLKVFIACAYKKDVFYRLDEAIIVFHPDYERDIYSTFSYYLKTIKFFKSKIKHVDPDVILSYGDYLNPISILASLGTKTPIYISDRSSPEKKFPFLIGILRKTLYPKSNGIIAQTERARDQKIKMLPGYKNIKVIPNPLRPITQHPDTIKENIILGVGRHYHVKGLDRLIKAIAEVELKDWKLVIAGNIGPETEELKLLVKNLHLDEKVVFLGAIKEIDKVFSKSKIFVLPSRSEGFPNALIEAMAHGIPSISFDIVAGPAEIIKDNINGVLIKDNDIKAMSVAINKLILNENLRSSFGENAFQKAREFEISNSLDSMIDIYKKYLKII